MTSILEQESVKNTDTPVKKIDYYSIVDESRRNMHGISTVLTQEDDLDQIETYREIADSHDPPVRGYPESYVQRMGLAEYRVLCMHKLHG